MAKLGIIIFFVLGIAVIVAHPILYDNETISSGMNETTSSNPRKYNNEELPTHWKVFLCIGIGAFVGFIKFGQRCQQIRAMQF